MAAHSEHAATTGALSTADAVEAVAGRALQLYDEVRTAHLERLAGDRRVTILFRARRYDFDRALAAALDVQRAGALGTLRWTLSHPVAVIEVSEPLMAAASLRTLSAVLGNRIRSLVRGERPARVVTYAIEAMPLAEAVANLPRRARLRHALLAPLQPIVWRVLDRIAFGTALSEQVYRSAFPARWPEHRVIPALPVSRLVAPASVPRPPHLVFLGDMAERKGFPAVLDVWPAVRAALPEARLTILGRGSGAAAAMALAAADDRVVVRLDPPRASIFETLERSKVLVLPSRRTPLWREQVGLPIVEALASGCIVVTTSETGLASWLQQHGHEVVPADAHNALAAALVRALTSARTPEGVVTDLPAADGRRAAQDWMYEGLR